jgi:hypothetical protein
MKNTLTWILPLLLAAAIAASPLLSRTGGGGEDTAADVLRAMEAGDPDAVQDVIRQQQKARMEDQREEIRLSFHRGSRLRENHPKIGPRMILVDQMVEFLEQGKI